jgi:hypothetical protein
MLCLPRQKCPGIPALGRLRQEDHEFEVNLGYVAGPCLKKTKNSRASVAHAYNPSYSGGSDQEDHGLRPALGNESLSQKYLMQKGCGRVALSGKAQAWPANGPKFKPQYRKTKTQKF